MWNVSWNYFDDCEYAYTRKCGDGRWHIAGGDRGVLRWTWESGIVYDGVVLVCAVVLRTSRTQKEKQERGDCFCAVFIAVILFNVDTGGANRMKYINNIRAKGSLTVEAAIVVPIALFCILWMVEKGISLYTVTVDLVHEQEMWEEFHPAGEFRRLELLGKVFDAAK